MRKHVVLLSLLTTSCVEYELENYDGVDTFTQEPAKQVDILLIVDNSCSMEPYQTQLGDNFDAFISYFIGADVDYHIGVVTTDMEVNPGEILGEIITPESDDPAQTFEDIVNVGTSGSGYEMGLETARLALTEPLVYDENDGFLRDEASLSIIFVSDEEDSSPEPVNDYINTFFDVKGHRARDVFNASALTVTDEDECTPEEALASSPGDRYVDVAEQTDGLVGNLCAENFEQIVTDLSMNVSRLRDTFYLSGWPDAGTLAVAVDEEIIPCDAGEWTYQILNDNGEDRPAVVFDESHIPEPGARIGIRYMYGGGDVAQFCGGGAS